MVAVLMVDGKKMVVGSVKLPAAKGTDQPMNGMIPLPIVFFRRFLRFFYLPYDIFSGLRKNRLLLHFFGKYAPFRRLYRP